MGKYDHLFFDHLEEEDYEDDDGMEKNEDILPQSTHFQNRVFLAYKKERTTVLQLINGEIEMKDFISAGMKSRNGALLQDLMEYLDDRFVNLPEEYSNFIKNISKAYSVSSLIQVTCEEPLKILKAFCQTNLDLLAAENSFENSTASDAPILESPCTNIEAGKHKFAAFPN